MSIKNSLGIILPFVDAPTEGISASWKRVVFKGDMISSCPYTFWAIEKMLEGIKNYDIYLEKSDRYNDPRSKLLKGSAWESVKSKVLSTLGWSENAEESLNPLKENLDIASADGIRFVVPPKTIYAGPNPRYFEIGRGITSYDLISD